MVNYIRHNLTEYDRTLHENLTIRTSKGWLIYREIKLATLLKIAEAYPTLADEVAIQSQSAWLESLQRNH